MENDYQRAFAQLQRSEILDACGQLMDAVTSRMDVRRYELVTLAAARRLRSSYCSLAQATVLAAE